MSSALKQISDKFRHFDDWHHVNKFSLILVVIVFGAIPITVFGAITLRQLDPQAATGKPTSLTPAYSSTSTTPTFKWDCTCYTTKYRVYLKEGNGTFYSGTWYKDVSGTSGKNSTPYGGWSKTPSTFSSAPAALTFGKTYYWAVSCVTGGCNASSTQSFTVIDNIPPSTPTIRTVNVTADSVTISYSATDNVGVKGYTLCSYTGTSASIAICGPATITTSKTFSGLSPDTYYTFRVTAFDAANNTSTASIAVTTLKKDTDGDGFSDIQETYMSTNPSLKCGVNAWPPDLDDSRYVDLQDMLLVSAATSKSYNRRFDMNSDGKVDNADMTIVQSYFGKTCS